MKPRFSNYLSIALVCLLISNVHAQSFVYFYAPSYDFTAETAEISEGGHRIGTIMKNGFLTYTTGAGTKTFKMVVNG